MQPPAPEPVRPPVARNLRAEFARTGLTITGFARQLGVDDRQILRWRKDGGPVPSWSTLTKIAAIFGRDPAWFYDDHAADEQRVAS